jgi:hypothetical protein
VTVIGDETTHGSDLRGSSLSVLETIAPSETVLDSIPEDDDPDVAHLFWPGEKEAARRTGNRCEAFCGKFVYVPAVTPPTLCPTCEELARMVLSGKWRKGRD